MPVMPIIPAYTPSHSRQTNHHGHRAHGGFIDTRDVIPPSSTQPQPKKSKSDKGIAFIATLKENCLFDSTEPLCFQIGFSSGRDDRKIITDEAGSGFRVQVGGTYRIVFEGAIITETGEASIIFQADDLNELYHPLTHFELTKPAALDQFHPVNVSTILPLESGNKISLGFVSPSTILVQGGSKIQMYQVA